MAASRGHVMLIIMATMVSAGESCFLHNCPMGGKRTLFDAATGYEEWKESIEPRACPSCGPDLLGTCAGPFTCCRTGFGCVKETAICHVENQLQSRCTTPPKWTSCGLVERGFSGYCVASKTCCTPEVGCVFDESCSSNGND